VTAILATDTATRSRRATYGPRPSSQANRGLRAWLGSCRIGCEAADIRRDYTSSGLSWCCLGFGLSLPLEALFSRTVQYPPRHPWRRYSCFQPHAQPGSCTVATDWTALLFLALLTAPMGIANRVKMGEKTARFLSKNRHGRNLSGPIATCAAPSTGCP